MPALDTDTIILASSALCISFGLVLLVLPEPSRGLRLNWAAVAMLYGGGGVLIGFRAVLPPWLANVFANMLVAGSVVLVHRGTWVMLGRRPPDRLYAAAVAGIGVAYYILTYPFPDIGIRLFLISLFRVPFFLGAAAALYPRHREGGGVRVLIGLLSLWSVWYLLRAGLALSSSELAAVVRTGLLQGINYLVATAGHLLIITSQLRMEAEWAMREATCRASELQDHRDRLEDAVQARTAELQVAKDEAERANRAKSHFLAAASHDLRQPLQALRLFLDLLDTRLRGSADGPVLAKAREALESSEGLLHALLDMSRLDAGVVPVAVETVALNATIGKLAEEIAETAARKGIVLRVVPSGLMVRTDRLLLERSLRNLLHNALRYTGEGRVLIGCRRDGDRVRIEVWDTGIGIPDDQLALIFDDFYQLGNSERDQNKGLGLGLAILRRVAQLLGWTVEVRSQLGRGSVFSIALPLAEPARETA